MKKKFLILKLLIKKVKIFEKRLFLTQFIYSVLTVLETIGWVIIPSALIFIVSNFQNINITITIFVLLFSIVQIIRILKIVLSKKINVYKVSLEQSFYEEIGMNSLDIPFEMVEDPDFLKFKEDALFPIETQDTVNRIFTSIPVLFQAIFTLIGVLTIVISFNRFLFLFLLLISLSNFLINRSFIKKETSFMKSLSKRNNEYVYYLRTIRNKKISKDVRIYSAQSFLMGKINNLFQYYNKVGSNLYKSIDMRNMFNKLFSILIMFTFYLYVIYQSFSSDIHPSQVILLVNASLSFSNQINLMLNELLQINQQIAYFEPYYKYDSLVKRQSDSGKIVLKSPITEILFDDVYFRYSVDDDDILKGLSFTLKENESLSIVGLNGSGKTTITKILMKLYKPQKGFIYINGISLDKLSTKEYLEQISVVFQDFNIFNYSLKENIIFDKDSNSINLKDALRESELNTELSKFPKGIDTKLSENYKKRSIDLSKGQEQKLVIARSIYKGGSLIILDEPTASLDPVAEEEVYRHFFNITKNRLSIFISHRLSSCISSDCIIFIQDGRVVETGDHETLMIQNGNYSKLFKLQASNYS